MANLGVDAAGEEAVVARTDLHAQVTAAFYGLMLAEEAEKIAVADLRRTQEQLEETRSRWRVGYASPLDLKSDEVAVSQARAMLLEAENRTLQAQQFLNMVLGQDISTPVTTEGSFDITYEELGADSLVRRALRQRPEIKALDRAERITDLSGNLARSAYSPSLMFIGSPGWQNPYQSQEGWGYSMSATVALEWPLYDGGKGLSQARVAGINSKKLAYSRFQAENGIELEVRSAYASWQEAAQQLMVQERLGEQMVELASMADEQYRMGVISALDYQDIMFSKTQVELARLASLYQMILAREDLINAAWLWDDETLEELLKSTEEQK
jgi:outer membrane protein TolC